MLASPCSKLATRSKLFAVALVGTKPRSPTFITEETAVTTPALQCTPVAARQPQ